MNKTILKAALCVAALMMAALPVYAQQTKPDSDVDYIEAKMKRVWNHRRDLFEFAGSNKRDIVEVNIALELVEIADAAHDNLDIIKTFIFIRNKMSCKNDKDVVEAMAQLQIDYYALQMGPKIDLVNLNLSRTKVPAIAVTGTQLKDDLREIKDRLQSIKLY